MGGANGRSFSLLILSVWIRNGPPGRLTVLKVPDSSFFSLTLVVLGAEGKGRSAAASGDHDNPL